MIPLETNVGMINPLQRSRVHCRSFRTLTGRLVLAEAAAETDGALVASETSAAPCIGRAVDFFAHQRRIARIDDEALPDVATNDVVNSVDVMIVFVGVEYNSACVFSGPWHRLE